MKKVGSIIIVLLSFVVTGCSNINSEQQENTITGIEDQAKMENQSTKSIDQVKQKETSAVEDNIVDYSEYFQGIHGCAVIYDESSSTYSFYNKEQCKTESSPLSTFKIVSALVGLENDVLANENATMEYSGMKYPVDTWNKNLTLKEAFETSCIWYFRQVADKVGQEDILAILKEIHYGNCDISEWNGSNVNSLPELNGFWLESSLKISSLQQVEVLKYIFGRENNFNDESLEKLKNIMYVAELGDGYLYGKTGSGSNGKAWFVGFIEKNDSKTYLAIYLEDVKNKDIISGNKAKEIGISILDDGGYPSYDLSWTEEEIINAINERSQYYKASSYYSEIIDYWENIREARDISNVTEPIFETDKKYYTKEEFENEPMLVIHLAKNEIYARHGYIFKNKDLYNYFMGCIWYSPTCESTDFEDSVFNEYEMANLEILAKLDTY